MKPNKQVRLVLINTLHDTYAVYESRVLLAKYVAIPGQSISQEELEAIRLAEYKDKA